MKKWALIFLTLLFLFGCSTYMGQGVYKPAPATYQEWSKYGSSTLLIKKSLLECDKPAPDVSFEIYERILNINRYDEQAFMNKLQMENICMERAGYKYNGVYDTKKICSLDKYKALPACQPNTVIPIPSVERRLNSWYCKTKTDYDYCLKHALAPQLCNPEKTKNPPPECLADAQNHPIVTNDLDSHGFKSSPMSPESQEHLRRELEQQQQQRNIQNQSNRQMNNMLKNTAPKMKR